MAAPRAETSEILIDKVSDWLKQVSLKDTDLETIVRGLCDRLTAAGLPLKRIHLSMSMLHPLYRAMGFTWRRGEGLSVEGYKHVDKGQAENDRFLKSPYFHLLNHGLEHMRRRLLPNEPSEFPIFDDLKEEGVTDYLCFVQDFGEDFTQGIMGSWSTDREEGYSEGDIAILLRIQGRLAVSARMAMLSQLASNMLNTYLGSNAGKRVLSGQIQRGDGETIRAALVMCDMRDSTAVAEQEGRQVYIDTLNQFFDAIATPFSENGSEILSFLGDGFIAVIPCARHRAPSELACRQALKTANVAIARMATLNQRRRKEGLKEIGFGIGLHVGNVMFGNVGLKDRLTFSAFGSAVNEVHRLENLTKKFTTPIVASDHFVDYCGGEWTDLGRETLRGSTEEMAIYAPKTTADAALAAEALPQHGPREFTDAEQLILLHRDSRKTAPPQRKAS